jgi:membrane-bound serine protease (ClpP class)
MRVWLPHLFAWFLAFTSVGAETALPQPALPEAKAEGVERVYVIPVRQQIGSAVLYVVRRGMKEAIEQKADAVVIDMDTPGGALDTTLEIMEALGRFPGTTITFVNTEAISAGAFIAAATDEIWLEPHGKIGAAAPVSASGQDIDKSMRQKIVSYLKAEVRARSEGKGYRGQVISAMIDEDYELKIGDEVLKPKGELLTLTASEAAKTFGEPPQSLLSAGTAKDLNDLIAQRFGPEKPAIVRLELTWSEDVAAWLNAISPVLLGLGLLLLFIEFKTPGFGIFGIAGISCLAIVFLGNYVAGLSGHEPILVFGLGLLLVAIELFFFPGIFVAAVAGLLLMLGSLVWSMMDHWPKEAVPVEWTSDLLVAPLLNLSLGILIAVTLGLALARFLPRGWIWNRLVLATEIGGDAMSEPASGDADDSLIGAEGVAVSALRPGGEVEVAGRRYEASVEVGDVEAGAAVVVRRRTGFGLIVERAKR